MSWVRMILRRWNVVSKLHGNLLVLHQTRMLQLVVLLPKLRCYLLPLKCRSLSRVFRPSNLWRDHPLNKVGTSPMHPYPPQRKREPQ